jgi:hypothetical protein
VPGYANPQAFNRYSYVLNNPVKLTDPTGHQCYGEPEECLEDDGAMGPGFPGTGGGGGIDGGGGSDDDNDSGGLDYCATHPGSCGLPPTTTTIPGVIEDVPCQTVTCRALSGDAYAMIELLVPSHVGWRIQLEGTVFIFSGTIGINGVYNFVDHQFGGSVDWSLGGGPGYGAGAAVTTGPLIGWASSNVEDVTSGNSVILSGSAAAEGALTVGVSAPLGDSGLYLDPHYGQVPATLYLGGGAGGAFADAGLSYSGTFISLHP